ncbi:MAG: DNA-directed RNA polymerase subunit E [Thermoplasmata archaeon]|nr:DNA-directed RNA polymerase subunit E [Thermoplasmata archaeon]
MKKELKACRNCRRITTEDICPYCGGETTDEWHGYVFILVKEKSRIAAEMGADNGEFALRVR